MPFGSLLDEIRSKKQQLQDMKVIDAEKSSFRRADLAKVMEKSYRQGRTRVETGKRRMSSVGLDGEDSDDEDMNLPDMPLDEVHKRLRSFGEPILLFGEDEIDVRRRLRDFEISNMDVIEERQRNDLQDALNNVDATNADELLRGEKKVERKGPKHSWEELQEMGKTLGVDHTKDHKTVRYFLKFLLEQWSTDLDNRSIMEKNSSQGRNASAVHLQTAIMLKPLFKQLKKKTISHDILRGLSNIVHWMMRREYIQANDAYVRMSIGNAPWPIGVTSVGIHARSGREKISTSNIAHVLNDEEQRKYIQGVKRLMTFCQKRWPNVPSKCLEFRGIQNELYPVNNDLDMITVEKEQASWRDVIDQLQKEGRAPKD